MDPRKVVDILD
jgi:hypothetical protein